ncbi:MAG: phosphotyrosine protein phosphatase [Desulfobulbaceae bacterium]|nr:phosphotyrosine protein phosphatase [Desulfobulbaceae bacterium]
MEKKHKNRLVATFTRMLEYKSVYVMNIPDEYSYMDPELVEELKDVVGNILK